MHHALMIQGCGSNVGKSLLVAGLCRAYARRGLKVAPFKPQNMSNNAAVTVDGGEIGRAQALQAQAAFREAHSDMNPVLLKPESERGAQVILRGKRWASMGAVEYTRRKAELLPEVLAAYLRLAGDADLVLIEGAGSPAEVNLRQDDIANMGFAAAADVPVVLVGDIDRGGVIAQLVGTQAILPHEDAARIKGFIVNKFRGDPALFSDARHLIAAKTGWADLGLVPWFAAASHLPPEDILDLRARPGGPVKIAVPRLPRIANFDDLDALAAEPSVTIDLVDAGRALPGDADLVLLPGSKSTLADLAAFRAEGWDIDLLAHVRRGGRVIGLCGGYQMMGQWISDPDGIEGSPARVAGLGLLAIETTLLPDKVTTASTGRHIASGSPVSGYEIHLGQTTGADCARPYLNLNGKDEGAVSASGRIAGTYLHGIFASDAFRDVFLRDIGGTGSEIAFGQGVDATLDALAQHLEAALDLDRILALAKSS